MMSMKTITIIPQILQHSEDFIKFATGIDLKDYIAIDNELNTGNKVKDYRADTIFLNKNKLVNLEFNQFVHTHTMIKNRAYAL